jgi:UDP-N-acetylglucosamine--N-acetylmuramyl-(pentapeptide) pyrophosphoryl-undecaprenol N-acetylglucosamine transferase
MELALGAATVAISRAGASSLAEIAAMRLPALLIPYPAATDQHQLRNARAFEATGAARVLDQRAAGPESLARALGDLVESEATREKMRAALSQWHAPKAAQFIAEAIMETVSVEGGIPRCGSCDRVRDGAGAEHLHPELAVATAASDRREDREAAL